MKDFLLAALPWFAMGIAVAIFVVRRSKRKKNEAEKSEGAEQQEDSYMLEGMCLGMCLGSTLASMGWVDLGIGISLGMCFGMLLGMCIRK